MKEKEKASKKSLSPVDAVLTKLTGLSLSEFLKLRKDKKELNGKAKADQKKLSTQDTITFESMFKDGVCRVSPGYYTCMIGFEDINYVTLDVEERKAILGRIEKPDLSYPLDENGNFIDEDEEEES